MRENFKRIAQGLSHTHRYDKIISHKIEIIKFKGKPFKPINF